MMEGGLMNFLAKGATEKIIDDADDKREALLKTFQVNGRSLMTSRIFFLLTLLPYVYNVTKSLIPLIIAVTSLKNNS